MKLTKKILCVVLAVMLVVGSAAALAACNNKVILVWGPSDHESIYMDYLNKFAEEHKDQLGGYHFEYAGSGDAGAYAAMNIDPTTGAGVYTFANDQMANLRNLGALSPVRGANLEWSRNNNSSAAFEATKLGDEYLAYPLQADNGYYLYYNKAAFRETDVYDDENDKFVDGFTFRMLYEALESKPDQMEEDGVTNWHNGIVTWAMGDSWYVSGVFFSVGGDYEVIYDSKGAQVGADCWFSYTTETGDWEDGDYTVGMDAYQCLKNSVTEADGKVSRHYLYSDGDKDPLNDYIDLYINPANEQQYKTPLAAVVCGTWKAKTLQQAWGDDYGATILPTLETDGDDSSDGNPEYFQMKNFAGYKHMGVNPMCQFAQESAENLTLLHELAQYLCGVEISVERYDSTGAGPANLEALKVERIANDLALKALNDQYNLVCKYPANYSDQTKAGQLIGNGVGYRNQDSVPANYWTPIQQFGNTLYKELSGQVAKDRFADADSIKGYLADLQSEIAQAAQ